jgi:hypothetical protein
MRSRGSTTPVAAAFPDTLTSAPRRDKDTASEGAGSHRGGMLANGRGGVNGKSVLGQALRQPAHLSTSPYPSDASRLPQPLGSPHNRRFPRASFVAESTAEGAAENTAASSAVSEKVLPDFSSAAPPPSLRPLTRIKAQRARLIPTTRDCLRTLFIRSNTTAHDGGMDRQRHRREHRLHKSQSWTLHSNAFNDTLLARRRPGP